MKSQRQVDTIQLFIGRPGDYVERPVEIFVNGSNFLEQVKAVELPFASREGHPDLAGGHEGLPAEVVFLPSRHLLGKPNPVYESRRGKADLYECDCGVQGCWPLCLTIQPDENTVTWKDFEQPHRSRPYPNQPAWSYDRLGPFVFDWANYEKALQPPDPTRH